MARAHPGEITLVAVGPLGNLALALHLEPNLPNLIKGVAIMGGAAFVKGNVTPLAEANIWNDAHAAAKVFAAPWSLTMFGLDVIFIHKALPSACVIFTMYFRWRFWCSPNCSRSRRAMLALALASSTVVKRVLHRRGRRPHRCGLTRRQSMWRRRLITAH
jgi:hypothetical protein